MLTTIHYINKEKGWQKKYPVNAPQVGDLAQDFDLANVSGEQHVRLSDFRGQKPVALVFGRFT